jgi:hypothetical protein
MAGTSLVPTDTLLDHGGGGAADDAARARTAGNQHVFAPGVLKKEGAEA